jgi:hypothetical protein
MVILEVERCAKVMGENTVINAVVFKPAVNLGKGVFILNGDRYYPKKGSHLGDERQILSRKGIASG